MASAIIVVVIFVLLALAILFICQNGGLRRQLRQLSPALHR